MHSKTSVCTWFHRLPQAAGGVLDTQTQANGQECPFTHLAEGFGLSTSIPGAAHRKWGELSITLRWEPHPWLCLVPWVWEALCFISSKINRLLLGGKGQICHLAGVDLRKKADSLTFQPSPPLPRTSTLHLQWPLVPQLQRGPEVLWPNGMSLKGFLVVCFLNLPPVQPPSYWLVLMGSYLLYCFPVSFGSL